jgi:tRNA A37 N6-isopentenylltransferase MiaA
MLLTFVQAVPKIALPEKLVCPPKTFVRSNQSYAQMPQPSKRYRAGKAAVDKQFAEGRCCEIARLWAKRLGQVLFYQITQHLGYSSCIFLLQEQAFAPVQRQQQTAARPLARPQGTACEC